MNYPKKFIDNITGVWGEKGHLWFEQLPTLITSFCSKWQLSDLKPFENLSYHYVARAYIRSYNAYVVLKVGIPSAELKIHGKLL